MTNDDNSTVVELDAEDAVAHPGPRCARSGQGSRQGSSARRDGTDVFGCEC